MSSRLENEGLWVELLIFFDKLSPKCPILATLNRLTNSDITIKKEEDSWFKTLKVAKVIQRKLLASIKYGCRLPPNHEVTLQRVRQVRLHLRLDN